MKTSTSRIILIFITVTIVATIALQLHWNIKNYEENKRRLLNEIQIAFDAGVENYYAEDAKKDFLTFTNDSTLAGKVTTLPAPKILPGHDPVRAEGFTYRKILGLEKKGPVARVFKSDEENAEPEINHTKISVKILRSGKFPDMKEFANRIIVSMLRDSIVFEKLDRAFSKELARKNINIAYGFELIKPDTLSQNFSKSNNVPLMLSMLSKSTYLPPDRKLKLHFSDPSVLALRRSSTEIILSLLLSLSIIGCLLFLLKIINRQKKVDEIRNDLIGNITHEFKTPITTISSAIEGIRNFNAANDTEKTSRYLDISERQLGKLEMMVEKLLETATLDTGSLALNPEIVDLVPLLKSIVEKYRIVTQKNMVFTSENDSQPVKADVFHLENVLSNLIDNAVKYGGDSITLKTAHEKNQVAIFVEDNGGGIEKQHRDKVFDKFYRIPKGNIHDVKGFGIGLYYSRKIIEKHGGTIELLSGIGQTTFKITLPDA